MTACVALHIFSSKPNIVVSIKLDTGAISGMLVLAKSIEKLQLRYNFIMTPITRELLHTSIMEQSLYPIIT